MEILWVVIILVGNFPGGIVLVGVILGGDFPGFEFSGWELSGGNFPGGSFPSTINNSYHFFEITQPL